MNRFIVHADTVRTGKLVDHGRSGARAVLCDDTGANLIQILSRDPGANLGLHGFEYLPHNAAGLAQAIQLLLVLDGQNSIST